jgi:hypothetical protein
VQAVHEPLHEVQAVLVLRHEDGYDVQTEDIERIEVERSTQLHECHQALLLHVLVNLALHLPRLAGRHCALPPNSNSRYVQIVEINVENIVHVYKGAIGNSEHKMLVNSQTRACILEHLDVLLMLVVAVAVCTGCVVAVVVGWNASTAVELFISQMMFCVLVLPTLTLAVGVPKSIFFGNYITSTNVVLLMKCISVLLVIETLLLFCFYV